MQKRHIGTTRYINHSKKTLIDAIEMVLNSKGLIKNNEYNLNEDIIEFNKGDNKMIKGFKNYVGSTILGYRFVLDKNISKKSKYIKSNKKIKNNINKIKILKKINFSK